MNNILQQIINYVLLWVFISFLSTRNTDSLIFTFADTHAFLS